MFKLESYITPVILSYVEKYVKNFKPEQSQVSLWGGDASFQNLDLRLEVLEEQLNLPFTFVSGHIHELLIHVPWVKITSEPIVVTINTIECILKLKDENQSENYSLSVAPRQMEIPQEEAPPGYIKSIVTKVINNITINCNNLILKYVEEDIVLSINVRFLSIQTVNNKWEPAFTDISNYEVRLQKIITIQDLTLCLDKMDTSGKIEIYQDPVLYRCSMTIRLIMSYHSNTAKRASITRLDLHCQKMEFSITEQQIPMILRLVALLTLLQSRQYPSTKEKTLISVEESENSAKVDELIPESNSPNDLSWGMWAWNTMSSVLPMDWDNDWSNEQHLAYSGHVIHFGFYIDDATITFKTVESVKEQLFYKSRKIKYKSFLSLRFSEAVLDAVLQGISMTNFTIGFGSIQLYPRGTCSCGYLEVIDGVQPPLYLVAGKSNSDYLKDTLFDSETIENQGKKRVYKKDVSYHLALFSVPKLLDRCPAFCMDYIHYIDIPDDITSERLAEFSASYEYSNFHEERHIRYGVGNLTIRLCSGLFHRIEKIKEAANKYDYTPYNIAKPVPTFDELPPVTVEEYEALRERIPVVKMNLFMVKSGIQLQLADHRVTGLPRQRKYMENRTMPLSPALSDDPFLSFECDKLSAILEQPLYPFRLVACASKQTEIPPEMLAQCYRDLNVQFEGVRSQVYLKSGCHTSLIMPCNVRYNLRMLLYPDYWKDLSTIHNSHNIKIDAMTITGTKAKIMVASSILTSLIYPEDTTNPLLCSSLYNDACNEKSPIYIELCLENINHKGMMSLTTTSCITNVSIIKIFAHNVCHQAFILSGPEMDDQSNSENQTLVTAVLQFPKDLNNQRHPAILSFQISPMKGCLDPLLLQWLDYHVTYYKLNTTSSMRTETVQVSTESAISDPVYKKKTFPSLHESVHSSSDKDRKKIDENIEKSMKKSVPKTNESDKFTRKDSKQQHISILARLTEYYPRCSGLLLNGSVGHIIIYIPTITMSGVGVEGIEQAKEQALQSNKNLQILVIKSPIMQIHSSNIQPDRLSTYLYELPIVLPEKIWINHSLSFPWTLEILNFECFTLKGSLQRNFIKKICFKATLDLTTKTPSSEETLNNKLSSLSLCLYIDTSPVIISISEEQVVFLNTVFCNITKIIDRVSSHKTNVGTQPVKEVKDIHFAPPRSSSSPTQLPYLEDAATTSTISVVKESPGQDEDDMHITAIIQWTITKVAVKLYVLGENDHATLKLVLELEDIITSVDIQSIYFKLKHKITTATIFHYSRGSQAQHWDFGDYVGLVLCGREDNFEKSEDSGFLSLTLTVAKSGNVHTRWGARKPYKTQRRDLKTEALQPTNAYITEVVIKIQMIDIIVPPSVLSKYIQIIKPFLVRKSFHNEATSEGKKASPPFIAITNLRNESLPLIYLDFKGFRLMLPVASEFSQEFKHDLLMIQVDGVRITPHAENPICRVPLRSDIYQLAAQANILNVPGSAVEDRQYQINVDGICAHTTTWKDYQRSVAKRMSQSYLYTMNENPAVEWNKLGNGSSLEPHFSTLPVITRFDFCFIIAPVIIFRPDTIVCTSAAEMNCLTDLELIINLNQVKLVSTLCMQFQNLISIPVDEVQTFEVGTSSQTSETLIPKMNIPVKQIVNESETDYARDSGVDFDIASTNSNVEKPYHQEISEYSPIEFLVNCGKVTVIVYDIKKPLNNESEMCSSETEDDVNNLKQPLLYAMVNQPNLYFSQKHFDQKLKVSCFDVAVCLSNKTDDISTSLPIESDFKIWLIQTKNGEPDPDTGIPPSFLVVKCDIIVGKNPQININMGRPTRVYFSLSRLNDLIYIKDKISECISHHETETENIVTLLSKYDSETSTCIHSATFGNQALTVSRKYNIPDINLTTKQFVFSFKSESAAELLFSLASLSASVTNVLRPERIYGNINWDSFTVSSILDSKMLALLNPCCCNVTTCLLWESWQTDSNTPQIQIQAESDCIYLDFGPKHVLIVRSVLNDFNEILSKVSSSKAPQLYEEPESFTNHEQHYKDDLKSGAFQFVDGNSEEIPFPYQVVFFSHPQQAMAWRYPHPRALTKIHVSPVPLETYDVGGKIQDRVPCAIEYWSETQMAYQRYVDLYLSETDSYRLDLPDRRPLQAAACVWRIVLLPTSNPCFSHLLSSKALIACLRIDSYFNPQIIPNIQAALNIRAIRISFYNHLEENFYESLPTPLSSYKLNGMIPESQCFGLLEYKQATFLFNNWPDNALLLNISGNVSLHILDYGLLILQEVLDSVEIKSQLSFSDATDFSLTCESFFLKLSPSAFHTLGLAAHLWNDTLTQQKLNSLVLTTRYVIANDTNLPIRFGQSGTDDNILLETRQCHFYSWRHASNQVLRIAIEENGWSWSKPFSVNVDGTYDADFSNTSLDLVISVNVSSLSATQKLVTFSGQLIIINQLVESFEMKLVKCDPMDKNKTLVSRDVFHIPASSQPSSIVLGESKAMAMRLRFSSIANLSWTGDIPLQPNARCAQPWLVKVPLQERGQFISIWVRIVIEKVNGKQKILAIASPLYMIRSYLPVPARVQIETPSLKLSLNTVVNGRGETQQLYCPGTFEHFHQLTFQIESGISASNPYVPLSYSSVDQRKFFKRPEKESIREILTSIEAAKEKSKWPFQNDDFCTWIAADQPQTHVQVKYEDAGFASSTLLLELQPWCFILNSVGTQLSIVSQDIELCRIPHYGIVAPPKLEGTFHIGVNLGDTFFMSSALQLVKPDWSRGFYMPRIQGLIPLEGNIKTCIDCGSSICMMNINSCISKDMRIVRISSNFVIGNMTDYELFIVTLAVPNSLTNLNLSNDLTLQSISILPSMDQRYAIPIVQWYTLFEKTDEPIALYILLRLNNKTWSCPVRVDQSLSRRCIALPNGHTSVPLVITTQEDKSTVYIMIHIDKHPQLFIENKCAYKIVVGQANEESECLLPDTQHFSWSCQIESNTSRHYTLPIFGSKLPDLPNNNNEFTSMLISGLLPDNEKVHWSKKINLSVFPLEQYSQLSCCNDVQMIMRTKCYTSYICFVPTSQAEMAAQELKNKLERRSILNYDVNVSFTENLATCAEEETFLNIQNISSSASTTTFFSAQEDVLEAESPLPSTTKSATELNNTMQTNKTHNKSVDLFTIPEYKSKTILNCSATIHFQDFSIVIMKDVNDNGQRIEVASLCMIDTIIMMDSKRNHSNLSIYVGDLQFDNQLFEHGGFDFPVVFISQKPFVKKDSAIYLSNSLKKNIKNIIENSLLTIDLSWETDEDNKACKDVAIRVAPISAYIEGTYITLLMDYATLILPPCFVVPSPNLMKKLPCSLTANNVYIPDYILVDTKILSHPLRLQSFTIEPVSILLSVHTSVHMYVAFDHSPLYFEAFDRKNLMTTPYRLGNALAMHYLSGAIFGVGWVVGSLEILGSPGGLAQALGSGLKDFISMPFQGLLQGPWGFIVGITHGSASLVKHITAGTVNSVTKLASSVARNLDRLTLDDEHLQRQEEFRRIRPQGVAQGLYHGLTGLGMSLLAAVAGLAHHPLQQVWSGETTPRGLVTGVGLGLVGVLTKPLSGAAELVALTGQGLLQGTGWNSLPSPRQRPIVQYCTGCGATSLRYAWRLMPLLAKSHDSILYVSNADQVMIQGANRAVTLVLTRQALLIVNVAEDSVEKILPLKDLTGADNPSETTMLRLYCSTNSPLQPFRKMSPIEKVEVHMDQQMRARVAEFLRTSSTGIASVSTNSDAQSESPDSTSLPDPENSLTFYINSDSRSYLLSVFNVVKRQSQGNGFIVI